MVIWSFKTVIYEMHALNNINISNSVIKVPKFPKVHVFISKQEGNFAICEH